ncbi:hypothetical protein [Imbroritus primus]|uniref:hypothetical protein n=1 Tax=Imbroritus primus TaxID=3058603 RepID=UPI000269695A
MTTAIRWTPEQLATHESRAKEQRAREATKRFQALGRLPKGRMNKTEQAYSLQLERRKQAGEILEWKFHPMNVRLADRTFYEVDFLVLHGDMRLEIHETKGGFTTDKGQMKIKLCAEAMPYFRFFKATKLPQSKGGGFVLEEF